MRRGDATPLAASLGAIALAACSAASPPAPPPPAVAAPVVAPLPAKLALVDDDADDERPAEVVSVGALPAFAGRFEAVPIPKKTAAVVSVSGRGEDDVWMLARGGPVLHWDGKRVADMGTPQCFTDNCCGTLLDCAKKPGLCRKPPAEGCHPFGPPCAMRVDWGWVEVDEGDVAVGAIVDTGGMRGSLVEAHLGKGGRWACAQGKDDMVQPGSRGRGDGPRAMEKSVGGAAVRFEGPAVLVNVLGGYSLVVDGRRVPLPADVERARDVGFEARGPADLWLWRSDGGRVWRGNGLAWTPLRTELAQVAGVWFADPGSAWMLGSMGEGNELLVRWDLGPRPGLRADEPPSAPGPARRFETPGATIVLHSDRPDFWLLGKTAFYFWDGRDLRRAEAPLDVEDAWRSRRGEVWVAGGERGAQGKAAPQGDPPPAPGAVYRLRAPEGPPP